MSEKIKLLSIEELRDKIARLEDDWDGSFKEETVIENYRQILRLREADIIATQRGSIPKNGEKYWVSKQIPVTELQENDYARYSKVGQSGSSYVVCVSVDCSDDITYTWWKETNNPDALIFQLDYENTENINITRGMY